MALSRLRYILSALPALCMMSGFALAINRNETRTPPASRVAVPSDPFPVFPADACGMGGPFGVLFFDTDRTEATHPTAPARLDGVVEQLRRDGGDILLD